MAEHRTKGGYESGTMTASELIGNFPESLKRPAMGAAPEPQDTPPRVPNLPCPKCGEADTGMRYCDGGWTLAWGSCDANEAAEHFHRRCPRCSHRWATRDVLGA